MRILILSQWYDPEPIPKPAELARELARRGHEVSVLTGLPHYPAGVLYPGYKVAPLRREEIDGIPVLRVFEWVYHGRASLGRILNYASFMISSIIGALFLPPCDVIYTWHPPLTIGISAVLISLIKRASFVYDVQDIWPESVVLSGWHLPSWLVKLMHGLERFIYRKSKRILVVTEGARENLVKKGVPVEKIGVAPHWVDEQDFISSEVPDDEFRMSLGLENHFLIIFAGNMGLMQGLDTVISAASLLANHREIAIALVGDGVDRKRLEEQAAKQQLSNVIFVERQPPRSMPNILASADALLVCLRRSELDDLIIPTKCLAYLAAARPIIVAAAGGAAWLIRRANAGLIVPPEAPEDLAKAILELSQRQPVERNALGENGRAFLVKTYSKQSAISYYEEALLSVSREPN